MSEQPNPFAPPKVDWAPPASADAEEGGTSASLFARLLAAIIDAVVVPLAGITMAAVNLTTGIITRHAMPWYLEVWTVTSLAVWLVVNVFTAALGLIPIVDVYLALIDLAFIFRRDRRCVHDLIGRTRVVRVGARGADPSPE